MSKRECMEMQNNSNWRYHIVTQSEIRAIIFYAHLNNYLATHNLRILKNCLYLSSGFILYLVYRKADDLQ
jgi:hypothetical protein